jgi:hypothetical protein
MLNPFLTSPNAQLWSREEVLARPSPAPAAPGVYAWYFDEIPGVADGEGCVAAGEFSLLYVGISPKAPPANGRSPSRSTLRQRLRTHYAGNAAGSTLRKTLGCLLAPSLGIALRRVGSGERYTFGNAGEQVLDDWMSRHARVTWVETSEPWLLERQILASGPPLPLNLRDNPRETQARRLRALRAEAVARADSLPILVDNGGPRRARGAEHKGPCD